MNFIETCESIFNEIQQLRRGLLEGNVQPDVYALQMGGIAQLEKQQKLMLAGMVAERKLRKKIPVDLSKGVLEIRQEQIECPDIGAVITRERCLDYSGEEKNHEQCQSCQYFRINRNLLIPKQINSK